MHTENFTAIACADADAPGLEQPDGEQPEIAELGVRRRVGGPAPAPRQSEPKGTDRCEHRGRPPPSTPAPQRRRRPLFRA